MRARRENITHSVRKRDPRWEPSEPPPGGQPEPAGEAPAGKSLPPFSLAPAPAAEAGEGAGGEGEPSEALSTLPSLGKPPGPDEPRSRAVVTIVDPRMAEIEPLIARGDWDGICERLGPADQIGRLPPTLGLIYAVARREGSGDDAVGELNALAIRCAASLFGVPPESDTALVLAKRLLRKNPAAWRTRPAPPRNVSLLIMLLALVIGLGVGWWTSRGTLMLLFR